MMEDPGSKRNFLIESVISQSKKRENKLVPVMEAFMPAGMVFLITLESKTWKNNYLNLCSVIEPYELPFRLQGFSNNGGQQGVTS